MNLNDYRAEDLPKDVRSKDDRVDALVPRRLNRERWVDWRNERFVYGMLVAGVVMCALAVCAAIAAPKIACALQTTSNEYCLTEIGTRR